MYHDFEFCKRWKDCPFSWGFIQIHSFTKLYSIQRSSHHSWYHTLWLAPNYFPFFWNQLPNEIYLHKKKREDLLLSNWKSREGLNDWSRSFHEWSSRQSKWLKADLFPCESWVVVQNKLYCIILYGSAWLTVWGGFNVVNPLKVHSNNLIPDCNNEEHHRFFFFFISLN